METSDFVEDFFEHHGVKGMRWGHRKSTGPQSVTVIRKRKGVKTKGGKGHAPHPEAIRVREIGQVGRKSGITALSNEDLRTYQNRLNLEQNVKRLQYESSSPPRKFIMTVLRQTGSKSAEEASTASARKVKRAVALALA